MQETYIPRLAGAQLVGDFPKLAVFGAPALPYYEDLVSLHTYGLALESSQFNYAEGHPPLDVVGTPKIEQLGATLRRADCFETGFVPQGDYTVISIAKPVKNTDGNTHNSYLASNFGNPSGTVFVGDSMLFSFMDDVPVYANVVQTSATAVGARGKIDVSGLDEDVWHVFASVIGGTDSNVAIGREGTLAWGTPGPTVPLTPDQTRGLRLGGFYPWAGTAIGSLGAVVKQMTAIYGRKLTTAQVSDVYAYLHTVWAPMAGLPGL